MTPFVLDSVLVIGFSIASCRRPESKPTKFVTDTVDCGEYYSGNRDMASFIKADIQSPAVRHVSISQDGDMFTIVAELTSSTDQVRHGLYAKQKALRRTFPMYRFNLLLADVSDGSAA